MWSNFLAKGHCTYGDRCKFSHSRDADGDSDPPTPATFQACPPVSPIIKAQKKNAPTLTAAAALPPTKAAGRPPPLPKRAQKQKDQTVSAPAPTSKPAKKPMPSKKKKKEGRKAYEDDAISSDESLPDPKAEWRLNVTKLVGMGFWYTSVLRTLKNHPENVKHAVNEVRERGRREILTMVPLY